MLACPGMKYGNCCVALLSHNVFSGSSLPPTKQTKNISAGPLDGINHWDYFVDGGLKSGVANPRQEMVYNYDSYILWTDEDTP